MDAEMTMLYDPSTDVVRVRTGEIPGDCVAVPMQDLTVLVSEGFGRIVGIDIMDLAAFARRYVSDRLIPAGARGDALFKAAEPHLAAVISLFLRNLGPLTKDQIRCWDDAMREMAARENRSD
jgi:hypothetical protein